MYIQSKIKMEENNRLKWVMYKNTTTTNNNNKNK